MEDNKRSLLKKDCLALVRSEVYQSIIQRTSVRAPLLGCGTRETRKIFLGKALRKGGRTRKSSPESCLGAPKGAVRGTRKGRSEEVPGGASRSAVKRQSRAQPQEEYKAGTLHSCSSLRSAVTASHRPSGTAPKIQCFVLPYQCSEAASARQT